LCQDVERHKELVKELMDAKTPLRQHSIMQEMEKLESAPSYEAFKDRCTDAEGVLDQDLQHQYILAAMRWC
jgi:hypothetical protein